MGRRNKTLGALLVLAVLVAPALDGAAKGGSKKLPTRRLACNTTLGPGAKSFRLGNNLDCSGMFAINVSGASDLVIDLGGHRLSGDNAANGIGVFGSNRVTIRNGVITDWFINVIVSNSNRVTLKNLTVMSASNGVIKLQDGVGHRVLNSTIIDDSALSIEDQGDSPDPSDILVSGNTLVNSAIVTSGAAGVDASTFSSNRVFGGAGPGISISDQSSGNTITSNTVIGAGDFGIQVNGDGADRNVLRGNTVRGHTTASGAGINVIDADRTVISGNRTTANRVGIAVTGLAENTEISGNNAAANTDTGIHYAGADTGKIVSNVASESGLLGINVFFGVSALVKDNTVKFTGYTNGLHDAFGTGINAPSATGSGNRVQGSDVNDCISADADLCDIGPPNPPPLIQCDVQVEAAATLHHPMLCNTVAAVDINGNGFTVDLGEHVVDGGAAGAEDAALHLSPGTHHVAVRGGLMTGSTNGINFLSPGSDGAHDVTISGALAVGNTTTGVRIQGVDLVPDGATVTAGRNRIEGSTFVGTVLTSGISVEEAPANSIIGNTIVGNSTALGIARSVRNEATNNQIFGGNTGASLSNAANDQLPAANSLVDNRIVGVAARGIDLQDAVFNTLQSNTIIGAGSVGIRSINGGFLGGGQDNVLRSNIITGGGGNGINLGADDKNSQLIGNVTSANHGAGIALVSEAEGTLLRNNRADENGADDPSVAGIIIADPAGVEDPDLLIGNRASRNGFLSETTGDDIGLGIDAASDTSASSRDNVARGNDNTAQCTQLTCNA